MSAFTYAFTAQRTGRKNPMRKLTLIQKLPIKGENGRG